MEDPASAVSRKKAMFDQIYPKHYLTGQELETVKTGSGIKNIEEYNFGCLEPNNITVNTRTLG